MSNEAILKEARAKVIEKEEDLHRPVEKRTKDINLIADLTCLICKYKEED